MAGQTDPRIREDEDSHARLLAIMEELQLPSPERMLRRIENMLGTEDRDRVIRALVADSAQQSREETRRILQVLVGSRDEWIREVDRLLQNCPS